MELDAPVHVRPRVLGGQNLRREVRLHREDSPRMDDEAVVRPMRRGDCERGIRPCPWVGCKHHLYLSVDPETGSITISFPDLEPDELEHSCALDVAERGGLPLERIGEMMNLTRERIRQLEGRAMAVMRRALATPSP